MRKMQLVETLKNSAQFERVRREGRTWGAEVVVLNAAHNGSDLVRCGFITAKKIGKAVQRNRARRLMREAVRHKLADIKPGWDLVWIARAPIVGATYDTVYKAVEHLLQRGRLIISTDPRSPQAVETAEAQSRIIGIAGGQKEDVAPDGGAAGKDRPAPEQ